MNEEFDFEAFDQQLGSFGFYDFMIGRDNLPHDKFAVWNHFVETHTRRKPRMSLDLGNVDVPQLENWFSNAPAQNPVDTYLENLKKQNQKIVDAIVADQRTIYRFANIWDPQPQECVESHFWLTRLAGKGIQSGLDNLAGNLKDQVDPSLGDQDKELAQQGIDRFFNTLGKSISCELDSILNFGFTSSNFDRIHQSLNQEVEAKMQQPHDVATKFDYGFIHRPDLEEDAILKDLIGGRFSNFYKPIFDLDLKGLSKYIKNAELGIEATFPFNYKGHKSSLDLETFVTLPFENVENPSLNLNLDYTWALHGGTMKWNFRANSDLDGEDYGFNLGLEIIPGKGK